MLFDNNTILFYLFSSIAIISGVMVIRAKNPVHSVLFLILVFCNAAGLLILLDLDFFAMIFLVVYVGAIAVLFLFVVMMLNIKMAEINENILRYLPIGGLIGLIFLFEIFLIINNDLLPILFVEANILSNLESHYYIQYLINNCLYVYKYSFVLLTGQKKYYHISTRLKRISKGYDNFCVEMEVPEYPLDYAGYINYSSITNNITNIESLGEIIYTYYFYYFLVASLILLVAMIGAIVLTMHKGIFVKRQEVFEQNSREFTKTVQKLSY